jgi:ribonucleoside-diphosphate reductase alpha chain
MPFKVRKRTGEIVDFEPERINEAIYKALESVGEENEGLARALSGLVQDYLRLMNQDLIDIETVQDTIEKVLMEEGHIGTAKSFILYRQKRKEFREAKSSAGIVDDCKLGINAFKVLEARYLQKNEHGKTTETPKELFERVASAVAAVEAKYNANVEEAKDKFLKMMTNLEFLPNSPCLMNAGTDNGQISSVFSLPIEDSTESIFNALKNAAVIHRRGGGTGFSFSKIRPRADVVNKMQGVASGPISFLKIFDLAIGEIKQGGKRSGANMAILRIDHPDILDFITCKESHNTITNYNLSVGITDKFLEALQKEENYNLINPRNGEVVGQLNAKRTLDLLATMAWKNGDPGIVFLDRINSPRSNPCPQSGLIETTSPCGEQPLLPYESVILSSINLSIHVIKDSEKNILEIDWRRLRKTVHNAIHFLDNATEINKVPLHETSEIIKRNRKVGLGVMGWADLLIKLKMAYNSPEAIETADAVMKFINNEARAASCELAKVRGVFPNFYGSVYDNGKEYYRVRNAARTTISPTGTISIISSCSSSIEPLFALSYLRKTSQFEMLEVNPLFEEIAKEEGFYNEDLMRKIAQAGSVQDIPEIPEHIKKIFLTAMDLTPEDHVRMQATFQKHVDNAVSKTVNFPYYATVEDVRQVFLLAYQLGCKGITIYRDGSKDMQVLSPKF